MDFKERLNNLWQLTLLPTLRRMFGKRRKGNTAMLVCSFYLIASMLGVICFSHHVNLLENDRLAAEYEQYITSTAAAADGAVSDQTAAQAFNHILSSKIELTAVFLFLMAVWAILSAFALARVFHATVEQDKYVYGLYVTFGSDTRQLRRQIHTEFMLSALVALLAAMPTAFFLTRAVYLQNGQTFRTGLSPFLQIIFWLAAVSLIGAGYLSHRITNSTCVELMEALDCSDYVSSPHTSRPFNKRLYNGSLRYARLAIRRMRSYYIPLVLTVSIVAAVFFSSMNLALEGEREAAEHVHEYTIEFSRGVSGDNLEDGYMRHLLELDDIQSVSAGANGSAEMLGTHLLAEKTLFANGQSESLIPRGDFYATDDIRILCADSDTRTELGGSNVLPGNWENLLTFREKSFNYTQIPESGTVVYMYPMEREPELNVKVGDTVRLALPRAGEQSGTLTDKLADGSYEYLTLTVSEVFAVPGVHQVTPSEATYICPRITEDYLLLNPEDYAAVTQGEMIERLSLDELYREDLPFRNLSAPAVLLLPEDFVMPDTATILMYSPKERITEQYSVPDPQDSDRSIYLNSDTFTINQTARHTYFYFNTSGMFNNDAEAIEQLLHMEGNSLVPYQVTELTVADQIVCPDLTEPIIVFPNDNDFFTSYSGDLCALQLRANRAFYQAVGERFLFGTDKPLLLGDYIGRRLFLHTKLEAGFFEEMRAQGLYTAYENESAYELSTFNIESTLELGRSTYFICSLSDDCNLGMDRYPAYTVPGNDFVFLAGLMGSTDRSLDQTDSYLLFSEALSKHDSGMESAHAGNYVAANDFTVSIADSINAAILTPGLIPDPLAPGEVTVVRRPDSNMDFEEGDYIQLAIRSDIERDMTDPQTAMLEGVALLSHLLEHEYDYISLRVTEVIEGEEDILYISEPDWIRICRTESAYQSIDIYLFSDTDLISLVKTAARIRALMGNWKSDDNYVTLVDHNRLWKTVTAGACNYPAIIRILSFMLILLLPLLWCSPQVMHFRKRREEFTVMEAVGRTGRQLRRMIAAECAIITISAGTFVALLCPFSVLCVQAAIYMMELPFEVSDFDTRAYLFMIAFVMLTSALSFLAAAPKFTERVPKDKKSKKGAKPS